MRAGMIGMLCGALTLGGCGEKARQEAGSPPGAIFANALVPAERATPPATDGWIGRWTGPEGLFLDVARDSAAAGRYVLTIKANLDSKGEVYSARTDGARLRFERAGKALQIRAGTGAETGFKWLAEKQDCLIVVAGQEGYCRDA